jgi:hypothetical protein
MTDFMESMLVAYEFTPSEMREMAIMASMHFEMRYGMRNYFQSVPLKINEAFKQLEDFRVTSEKERKKKMKEREAEELAAAVAARESVCACSYDDSEEMTGHAAQCPLSGVPEGGP